MHRHIHTIATLYWQVASLPATLAHELTHMLLARPWARQSAIIWDRQGLVHGVDWADEAPAWGIWLASIGPTILGSVVGLIGLWQLARAPPTGLNEWLLAAAIAGWWTIYVVPSGADLQPEQNNRGDS